MQLLLLLLLLLLSFLDGLLLAKGLPALLLHSFLGGLPLVKGLLALELPLLCPALLFLLALHLQLALGTLLLHLLRLFTPRALHLLRLLPALLVLRPLLAALALVAPDLRRPFLSARIYHRRALFFEAAAWLLRADVLTRPEGGAVASAALDRFR
ncbi:MAG TPA: hypothetical protein VGA59_09985, partial [Ramlibacter sp.]